MSWRRARRIRQVVQLLSFAFFVFLMFAAIERRAAPALADIFFRLDPLVALAGMLAERAWIPRLGLALLTIALTLLVGRAWCGWICPLGTLLEWTTFRRSLLRSAVQIKAPGRRRIIQQPALRRLKYLLLALILAMALFGSLPLLVFDPLAILSRTATTVILLSLTYAVNAIEAALYPLDIFNPLLDGFESLARGRVLPVIQPAYTQSLLIALLFVAIVALNALAPRFWCRYLCPLGALLGMLAKISLLRPVIGSACNRCTRCVLVCRPGAIDFPEDEITSVPGFQPSPAASHPQILASECTLCLDCLDGCKQSDIRFQVAPRPAPAQEFDLTRRQALQSLAAGAAGVLLLGSELAASQPDPHLVRPPGVEDEAQFLQRCIRCASCIKICPTTALQPTLVEAGLGALWTPRLLPRAGYCDFGCNACGQVCPSGAIPDLSLETKRQAVIYKASVNRDRCLPWASATPCIVCEEMCPLPEKAIQLEEVDILAADGGQLTLQRPSVDRELCIGCGICEHACPLEGEAAIRVYRYLT